MLKVLGVFTLGSVVGTYTIEATGAGIIRGSPLSFTAIAMPGTANNIAVYSGNNQ